MEIEKQVAYWCKTEELAREFLQECTEQRYEWKFGESCNNKTYYNNYFKNTCYFIEYPLTYGDKDYFEKLGCKIVEYKGKQEEYPTITSHIVKGNKVIVKLSNGNVGTSKCNTEDKFDIGIGTKLAVERAYGIEDKKEEKYDNEEKYVKVINKFKTWCNDSEFIYRYFFEYSQHYIEGHFPQSNKAYKYIAQYRSKETNEWLVYLIQDIDTKQVYFIEESGIKFVDKPKEKEKFVPYLYFGNSDKKVGNIGEGTDIVDILGNKLRVGDTVFFYKNKEKDDECSICKEYDGAYVMGLRYAKWENGYLNNSGINCKLIKSRSYKEIKNGEIINNIKYILKE